jgi:hypothetical protein
MMKFGNNYWLGLAAGFTATLTLIFTLLATGVLK